MAIVTAPYDGGRAVEVHCDGCDRPIRAAADGVVVYEPAGQVGLVRHAHRAGPCRAAVERAAAGPGGPIEVRPLDVHLSAVVINLGLEPKDLDLAMLRELLALGWVPGQPAGADPSA